MGRPVARFTPLAWCLKFGNGKKKAAPHGAAFGQLLSSGADRYSSSLIGLAPLSTIRTGRPIDVWFCLL